MDFAPLKPWLTVLVMPPLSLLLLLLLAALLSIRWRITARICAGFAFVSLWFLSTHIVAVGLEATLLPQYAALTPSQVQTQGAQAIVVLGGGMDLNNPEYGATVLHTAAYERLRYGYFLKAQTGLPLFYSGGYGLSSRAGSSAPSMVQVLAALARVDGRAPPDWVEGASRDTRENAQFSRALLQPKGIDTVVLVTNAYHMPRSVRAFERAGFRVIPAPMGFSQAADNWQRMWLPSGEGMTANRQVLRERLGLWMRAY